MDFYPKPDAPVAPDAWHLVNQFTRRARVTGRLERVKFGRTRGLERATKLQLGINSQFAFYTSELGPFMESDFYGASAGAVTKKSKNKSSGLRPPPGCGPDRH